MLTVVSPHLDDAVLSAWSVLSDGGPAQAVTCFAGVPDAGRPLAAWDRRCGFPDPATASRARRDADARALAACGAGAVHLDLLDVDYRLTGPARTAADLTAALRPVLAVSSQVWLPAGIGLHVDHRLVARAVLAVLRDEPGPQRVCVYADQPYASAWGWPDWVTGGGPARLPPPWLRHVLRGRRREMATQWSAALGSLGLPRSLPHVVTPLTEDQVDRKLTALAPYREQLDNLTYGPRGAWSLRQAMSYEACWVLRDRTVPAGSRPRSSVS